jgi:hypothetical protein
MQVAHRSMGGYYEERRLLFRGQAKLSSIWYKKVVIFSFDILFIYSTFIPEKGGNTESFDNHFQKIYNYLSTYNKYITLNITCSDLNTKNF